MAYLLQHLLTESAARFPAKEAVRFNQDTLTYSQLETLTNQVARELVDNGIKPGDRVGIYVNKSLASVMSVFGIMKAGAVYVPLDPGAPAKRLAYITRNGDIKVLLTSTRKLASVTAFFAEGTPLESVLLTDNEHEIQAGLPQSVRILSWTKIRNQKAEPVTSVQTIETDLAYILYTSGSTGDPKGVMISHRTIFTFVNWCFETFKMTENDRVTSYAPLHFDLSTFDIYVTIRAGGTIVLVPENLSVFPERLADLLQNERITVTYLVPSILSLMVSYGKLAAHDFSNIRAILFAGEVFPIKFLRQLVAAIPHPDYYNLYGPTETNVCTYYKVQAHDLAPESSRPVPIGIPCENIGGFVVSDGGQLVTKPGDEGELWIRGSCVAQGYWGDPEKTAQRFVRNPFQPHFDEIVYRTGDIVTLDADGVNWRYIGRRDHMIKSRGYRIELGEIETVLYSQPQVKEAAVIAIPDELLGNRIKAYVVPLEKNELTPKILEAHCGNQLPRYMVPETIEFRDALPKTSNGKVDRILLYNLNR